MARWSLGWELWLDYGKVDCRYGVASPLSINSTIRLTATHKAFLSSILSLITRIVELSLTFSPFGKHICEYNFCTSVDKYFHR
jgi:hypothetical protein